MRMPSCLRRQCRRRSSSGMLMTRAHGQLDEERQRAVDPVDPLRVCAEGHAQQRHGNAQQHRADAYGRRVDAGKAGDERLGAGLAGAGVLHKVENFRDGGFAEGLCRADLQNAAHIDAAADDLVALGHIAGEALARQGAGVQGGIAADDDAVQRDLSPGCTTMMLPTVTSSGSTCSSLPSFSMLA